MVIQNKANGLKAESDEVLDFVNTISNPQIEEHIDSLPIPPQAKEFFVKLTKTVMLMAKEIIK